MINAEQIRAARAILDWSTADLAKQANMTVNGINKIERGHVQAHRETVETIQATFEAAGIEFLPNSGLRKKNRIIQTHEGEDANRLLLDDVFATLRDTKGEVLIAGLDENLVIKDVDKKFLDEHLKRLAENNIHERLLIKKGDTNFVAEQDIYRWVPEKYFSPYPLYIYGPKLALVSWAPTPRCIIIHDEAFAESTRRLFNYVWDLSEIPSHSKGQRS
ncbi:MAG: hypothetical protein WAO98_03480 [Alphaproteobacteria bacterium]